MILIGKYRPSEFHKKTRITSYKFYTKLYVIYIHIYSLTAQIKIPQWFKGIFKWYFFPPPGVVISCIRQLKIFIIDIISKFRVRSKTFYVKLTIPCVLSELKHIKLNFETLNCFFILHLFFSILGIIYHFKTHCREGEKSDLCIIIF